MNVSDAISMHPEVKVAQAHYSLASQINALSQVNTLTLRHKVSMMTSRRRRRRIGVRRTAVSRKHVPVERPVEAPETLAISSPGTGEHGGDKSLRLRERMFYVQD